MHVYIWRLGDKQERKQDKEQVGEKDIMQDGWIKNVDEKQKKARKREL